MRSSDFIVPFLVSATIHAGALYSDTPQRNAEVSFKKGASAVTLNIVGSSADEASGVMPAAAEPAGKQSLSAPPSSSKKEITFKKTGLTQDVPLHSKKKLAVQQHKQKIHKSGKRKENAKGKAASGPVFSKPHAKRSETKRHLSAKPSLQNKKEPVRHAYSYPVEVAAINPKNNDSKASENGVTSPAAITGLTKPKYPRYSRINGEEGTVVFIVEVHADGRPGKIEMETSSGYRRLDRAAANALEKAAFVPAMRSGKAVASIKQIAFRFDLEGYGN
ncbi:MAG: TonB family protein [Dissulfuribacterales bacterium]